MSFFDEHGRPFENHMLFDGTTEAVRPGGKSLRDDKDAEAAGTICELSANALFFIELPSSPLFQCSAGLLRASVPAEDGNSIHIVAVHKVVNPFASSHYDLTKEQLGTDGANEVIAFHGTSLASIPGICQHGFVVRVAVRNATQFGQGLYLSPSGHGEQGPLMALDEQYSSKDAAGVQHLLLCNVLRGTSEQLRDGGADGNDQFQPSKPCFTSGIDGADYERSHRLVMWSSKLSTHVCPVAVVSVRVRAPHDASEFIDGIDGPQPQPAQSASGAAAAAPSAL